MNKFINNNQVRSGDKRRLVARCSYSNPRPRPSAGHTGLLRHARRGADPQSRCRGPCRPPPAASSLSNCSTTLLFIPLDSIPFDSVCLSLCCAVIDCLLWLLTLFPLLRRASRLRRPLAGCWRLASLCACLLPGF